MDPSQAAPLPFWRRRATACHPSKQPGFARKPHRLVLVLTTIGTVTLLTSPARILNAGRSPDPSTIDDLVEIQARLQEVLPNALQATVAVGFGGTGVIVSRDGFVLSAAHVTGRPDRKVSLQLQDGREVRAETRGRVEFADAGTVRILDEGDWPFAPMASADSSQVGDWCFALGHPSGVQEDRGPVVRVGRIIEKERNMIRTDCQLLGGDSGGPLFNLRGEVIGIHSRVSDELDDNYHAPIEAFHRSWTELVAGQTIPRQHGRGGGFLAIETSPIEQGLRIEAILRGSSADKVFLRRGMVITRVDDYDVRSPEELILAVDAHEPGEDLILTYLDGELEYCARVEAEDPPRRRRFRRNSDSSE